MDIVDVGKDDQDGYRHTGSKNEELEEVNNLAENNPVSWTNLLLGLRPRNAFGSEVSMFSTSLRHQGFKIVRNFRLKDEMR